MRLLVSRSLSSPAQDAEGCDKQSFARLGDQCRDDVLPSWVGAWPHPYPMMVRDFQSVIGREAREQIVEKEGRLPDVLVACVGGGSNAIGLFHAFLNDESVRMIGVEAGGRGDRLGEHAARFMNEGRVGVLQGTKSYLLQDEFGQIALTHSISAGLDYASVGPEHAFLHDSDRVRIYVGL